MLKKITFSSTGNILLTIGIVIVSILIALTVQAWYTMLIAQSLQTEQVLIPPEPDVERTDSIEVSKTLEEKYEILRAIDAANPTSTLSTEDKKKVLRSLTTGVAQSESEETQ